MLTPLRILRAFLLYLLTTRSIQVIHATGSLEALVARIDGYNKRITALEAFVRMLNTTSDGVGTNITTFSTSYVASATPTSVPVTVGLSGKVVVTCSANVGNNNGASAEGGLYVDGTLRIDPFLFLVNNTGGSLTVPGSATIVISPLSPGLHTFELRFKTNNGAISATFGNPVIVAEPI
jgi:hypothetical protein